MSKQNFLFTSEQVSVGHPDKTCDLVVEHIAAAIIEKDPSARTAIEGLLAKGFMVIAGEVTTDAYVNIEEIARKVVTDVIGFDRAKYGLDGHNMGVLTSISEQSSEIAGGVFNSLEARQGNKDRMLSLAAGDQGIVFAGAVNHNSSYHPVTHKLASLLAEKLLLVRENSDEHILYPDAKTQVTVEFVDGQPKYLDTVLVSTQHSPAYTLEQVQAFVIEQVILPTIKEYNEQHAAEGLELIDKGNYIVNPAGIWTIGSSSADVGLVNRKIVADTTGGWTRHGGGGLNGKDRTKQDRIGVYGARHAALNLVAAGVAERVELQLAYAIGQATPVSIFVDTFGTENISSEEIDKIIKEVFDFRPLALVENFAPSPDALRETAKFGHLGRNPQDLFTWERLDKVNEIKSLLH